MIQLPNGCKCSQLKVFPNDWEKPTANISIDWKIFYRFYDANKNVKQVVIKRVNGYHTQRERKYSIEKLLKDELIKLQNGYNPFLEKKIKGMIMGNMVSYISPNSSLQNALLYALELLKPKVVIDHYKNVSFCIQNAIKYGRIDHLKIGSITRRDVLDILDNIGQAPLESGKPRLWSAFNYNFHRKNLGICFGILGSKELIQINPVDKFLPQRKARTEAEIYEINDIVQTAERLGISAQELIKAYEILMKL